MKLPTNEHPYVLTASSPLLGPYCIFSFFQAGASYSRTIEDLFCDACPDITYRHTGHSRSKVKNYGPCGHCGKDVVAAHPWLSKGGKLPAYHTDCYWDAMFEEEDDE